MPDSTRFPTYTAGLARNLALLVCAAFCINYSVRAGETTPLTDGKSTPTQEQPEAFNNWIELGIGGLIINGDEAQFKQEHRMSYAVYCLKKKKNYEKAL